MATAKRLIERVSAPFSGSRVDREKGVIYGVKLCGFTSVNGRDYPAEMFRRDIGKYENVPINFNHGRERRVEDVAGRIKAPRVDADGTPRGDAHLLKSHPMYERVMEAAERDPGLFGFSHVALCRTKAGTGGRERVEGMDSVESVDLVAQPATTGGFFEDRSGTVATKIKFAKLVEAVIGKLSADRAKAVRKWHVLAEDDATLAPMMDTEVDAPADDAGGDDSLDAAFAQLMHAQLDALLGDSHSLSEFLSNIRELYKTRAKVMGKAAPKDADDSDGTPASEGKKASADVVVAECKAAGLSSQAIVDHLPSLSAIPTKEGRAAVITTLKAATEGQGAERPKSTPRTGPTTPTKPVTEQKLPSDPKDFAARYRTEQQ